ncbi:DNA replication/repair protein RecF [Legionella genomosp. 1]|uniref:DNA replication/repair protein RecF n=1 Tax=Legionella genomosp. 1 TaxID=1093625 RepID=UPI001055851F|nr:DNA replication and repair protein RecF [Legionella genomosp. 1]
MKLAELSIHHLRNFDSSHFNLHPHINIIRGVNGSGKTSFLEAIHLLSTGHSFRTRETASLVTLGQGETIVFARTSDEQTVSIKKILRGTSTARINHQPCLSASQLASFLACQIFYQTIFQIIDAGPSYRRELLDWGVFHVEHSYFQVWRDYHQALKQRNALLKQSARPELLYPWNKLMSDLAELIHQHRLRYFDRLRIQFNTRLSELTQINASVSYYKGWDKKTEGRSLESVLDSSYSSDLYRQFTQYGVHNADIVIQSEDTSLKAKSYFSRGQQKILLLALKFAQIDLLDRSCILLMDDLSSELDRIHLDNIMQYISGSPNQFFITAKPDDLPSEQWKKLDSKEIILR